MSSRSLIPSARFFGGAAVAATLLFAATPGRAADGPFAALPGSWSGTGTVSLEGGSSERIRCRATYDLIGGGKNLQLAIRCASDSYNFELMSSVVYDNGSISGSWTEAVRNVSGRVTGRASGNQIQAHAEGSSFSANLTLTTRGNNQSVAIKANGGGVTGVTISMARK